MIIYAQGHDRHIRSAPFIIDTEDIIYVRGCDKLGSGCMVYLRHNISEKGGDTESVYPVWVALDMSVKELFEKMKKAT